MCLLVGWKIACSSALVWALANAGLASWDQLPPFCPCPKLTTIALSHTLSHTLSVSLSHAHAARFAAQAVRAAAGDIADGRADGHIGDESIDGSALLLLKLATSESGSMSEKV